MTLGFADIFQIVSFTLIFGSLLLLFFWSRRDIKRRLWSIVVAIWLIHSLIFYAYVILAHFCPVTPRIVSFTDWSAVLRFHTYATVFMIAFTLNKLNGRLR